MPGRLKVGRQILVLNAEVQILPWQQPPLVHPGLLLEQSSRMSKPMGFESPPAINGDENTEATSELKVIAELMVVEPDSILLLRLLRR
jgi:hypothetical protein